MINRVIRVIFFVPILLIGCYQNTYKAFYAGEGSSMFYVFPVEYRPLKGAEILKIDFTLNEKTDSVRVNYTLISREPIHIITSNYLIGNEMVELLRSERMLFEKRKKEYFVRYSSVILKNELNNIFQNPKSPILLNSDHVLYPTKKAVAHLNEFNSSVLKNIQLF